MLVVQANKAKLNSNQDPNVLFMVMATIPLNNVKSSKGSPLPILLLLPLPPSRSLHQQLQRKIVTNVLQTYHGVLTTPLPAAEIKSRGLMALLKLSVLLVSLVFTIEVNIHLPLST